MAFLNIRNQDVYDNNPGREKIVVHSRSTSIKTGKFEGGLLKRINEYKKHLHVYSESNDKCFIFEECFSGLIVFDTNALRLGVGSCNAAKVFECYWNGAIVDFLNKNGDLGSSRFVQNKRTEWWHIDNLTSCDDLLISLNEHALQIAAKVDKATESMSFSGSA